MSEKKINTGLALSGLDRKTLNRDARKASSTEGENIEKKRLNFAVQAEVLKRSIERLKAESEPPPPESATKAELDAYEKRRRKAQQDADKIYTMVSLSGITGLFDGLGLLVDTNTVEMIDENEKTGERIAYRISIADMLFELVELFQANHKILNKQLRLMEEFAKKQGFAWKGRFTGEGRAEEEQDDKQPESQATEPIPAGVPEADLKAARAVTPEQVDEFLGKKK